MNDILAHSCPSQCRAWLSLHPLFSAYPLLGAYLLTTCTYKRMRLLTRVYGIRVHIPHQHTNTPSLPHTTHHGTVTWSRGDTLVSSMSSPPWLVWTSQGDSEGGHWTGSSASPSLDQPALENKTCIITLQHYTFACNFR